MGTLARLGSSQTAPRAHWSLQTQLNPVDIFDTFDTFARLTRKMGTLAHPCARYPSNTDGQECPSYRPNPHATICDFFDFFELMFSICFHSPSPKCLLRNGLRFVYANLDSLIYVELANHTRFDIRISTYVIPET